MTDAGGLRAIKGLGDQAGELGRYEAHSSAKQQRELGEGRWQADRCVRGEERVPECCLSSETLDVRYLEPGSLGDAEFARFCLETLEERGAGASSGHTWTVVNAFFCLVAKEGLCGAVTAQPDGRAWRAPFMEAAAYEDNKNSGLLEKIPKPAVPTMVYRPPPPTPVPASAPVTPRILPELPSLGLEDPKCYQ